MTVSWQSFRNAIANIASLAAIVLGAIPATDLPASVRVPLIVGGSIVQAIEHWANVTPNAPTLATPPTPPPPA